MYFNTYWELQEADPSVAWLLNWDEYRDFFIATLLALHNSFVVCLHNLTHERKDTANFPKLFNYINSQLSDSDLGDISELNNIMSSHQPMIDKIYKLRNQHIAHNQLSKDDLYIRLTYTRKEGQALLDDLARVFNVVCVKSAGIEINFNTCPVSHLSNVLRGLALLYKKRDNGELTI